MITSKRWDFLYQTGQEFVKACRKLHPHCICDWDVISRYDTLAFIFDKDYVRDIRMVDLIVGLAEDVGVYPFIGLKDEDDISLLHGLIRREKE